MYFPFSLFNELLSAPPFGFGRLKTRSFPNGIAKVHLFFELANFFEEIFEKYLRFLDKLEMTEDDKLDMTEVAYFFIDAITR